MLDIKWYKTSPSMRGEGNPSPIIIISFYHSKYPFFTKMLDIKWYKTSPSWVGEGNGKSYPNIFPISKYCTFALLKWYRIFPSSGGNSKLYTNIHFILYYFENIYFQLLNVGLNGSQSHHPNILANFKI